MKAAACNKALKVSKILLRKYQIKPAPLGE